MKESLIKTIINNLSFGDEFDLNEVNLTPDIVMKTLEDLGYYLVYYDVDGGDFECWFDYRDPSGTYDLSFVVYGMTFKFKICKEEIDCECNGTSS